MKNYLYPYRGGLWPSLFNTQGLFDDAFDSFFNNGFGSRFGLQEDKDGNYSLEFALPGYKQDDVEVELKENVLTVRAKNEARGERTSTVTVWADIDPDKIKATLTDGLLSVTLPKIESVKPRKIKIQPKEVVVEKGS